MDIDTITSLIGTTGFPICMCLVLMWYINTTQSQLTSAINELKETLAEIKGQLSNLKDGD